MPGLIYGAVMSWQRENPPMDDLNAAISRLYYLDSTGSVVGILARLHGCEVFSWHDMVLYRAWKFGLLEQGSYVLDAITEAVAAFEKNPQKMADDTAAASEKLAGIAREHRIAVRSMDTSARSMLPLWLTAIEAMDLCNQVGCPVLAGQKNPALAARLEYWFRQYETQWRAANHESELWRVRDVIYWYADQLR